ncbi:hypothetical protein PGTUg99_036516 [Puccinia graminis f. sp. tritici]|uniref:Uncharacterized protein n=1 Tax=Puccinia graminis f. sp. tritici TaxID=56615 RepID=A0A5B0N619_PUCGR|nr:hypothetical protein PGTUg99_036516 [Puccinia graminis f. sp. tritici]
MTVFFLVSSNHIFYFCPRSFDHRRCASFDPVIILAEIDHEGEGLSMMAGLFSLQQTTASLQTTPTERAQQGKLDCSLYLLIWFTLVVSMLK